MKYITKESVQVSRSVVAHPKIKYSWDYGWVSANPHENNGYNCGFGIAMILDNDKEERMDFTGNSFEDAANKAEQFLETLI